LGSSRHCFTRIHKGYFISHAHLDHVSGLIINSPADVAKQFMQQQSGYDGKSLF
jgi:3',5'-cyclic-nucleotide phosphodiesterase